MLSRVANALYWMGRYMERAENVARFIDVGLSLSLDLPSEEPQRAWAALLKATGEEEHFSQRVGPLAPSNATGAAVAGEAVVRFLSFDRENENSILSCLYKARENARGIREVISSEMWEAANRAYLLVQRAAPSAQTLESPHAFFREVKLASHLFRGLHEDTMSHGEGWHFVRMGSLIERADQGSRIIEGHDAALLRPAHEASTDAAAPSLVALLKSMSGYEMYRKRHHRLSAQQVVEFLLLDREFPRSALACLLGAQHSLHTIAATPVGTADDEATRALGALVARLAYLERGALGRGNRDLFLRQLRDALYDVDVAIGARFFGAQAPDPEGPSSRLTLFGVPLQGA
jgi:uncharacterized alpha-E superfamily protein